MVKYLRISAILAVVALSATLISSCSKSDYTGPILGSDSANYRRTFTIDPGKSATLESKFLKPETLSYEWSMDGKVLATDGTSYTFTSTEPGTYIITQRIYNNVAQVFIDYYVTVRGGYDYGSFIYTNNSDGAAIQYVSGNLGQVEKNLFEVVNPGKSLGSRISSATTFFGKTYILSETEGIIVVNPQTLKEIGRISNLPAKPNFLVNVDRATALLSTDNGVYAINLSPLSLGEKVVGINGRVGMMVSTPKYTMALTINNGVMAINNTNLLLAQAMKVGKSGLAADVSGNVWTTYQDTLYSISQYLRITKYLMPTTLRVGSTWNPWNEGTLTRSPVENSLFFIGANMDGSLTRSIYRLNLNNVNNITATPFITLDNSLKFTGVGFRINSENNIVASTVNNDGSNPQVVVYRAGDGTLVNSVATSSAEAQSILFNKVN